MKKLFYFFLFIGYSCFSQELHPYMQNPTPTSMYVNWKTNDNNIESTVEYGTTSTALTTTVSGNTTSMSGTGYASGTYMFHKAKITNLTPNTKYFYRVKTGSNYSLVSSFKTLPNPGQAATTSGHIRFLLLGDNQLISARYDSLVSAAKRKVLEKYGAGSVDDHVSLIQMVGDQVDNASLDHYDNIHFKKVRALSKSLPIMTLLGNHEYYSGGGQSVNSYYSHFETNEMTYQGITGGGTNNEDYYAYQAGNVLFIALNTENTSNSAYHATQSTWLTQVMNAANNDNTVDWIISLGHRPYEAEQYVGDVSSHVRNTYLPQLKQSSKFVLHVGAHHHIYARGQFTDTPNYHIISGGTAWDQYWGMAAETDFKDVQKTISNWMYQIVDVDLINDRIDVESYSIGSIYKTKDNELMDSFHRKKNQLKPATPTISNNFSSNVQLPLTINGSSFSSLSGEQLNTSQFLISTQSNFSVITKDSYRDFENLFGKYNFPAPNETRKDSTTNINLGLDITKLTLNNGDLANGTYYLKLRYRDKNLEWSNWSNNYTFTVDGSVVANPTLTLNANTYLTATPIIINYSNAPTTPNTWIGIYKEGQSPGGPNSTLWQYTNNSGNGATTFNSGLATSGWYFVALFINDGYTEVAERKYFYVGLQPVLSMTNTVFNTGNIVPVNFTNAPNVTGDKVKVFKMGQIAGINPAIAFSDITTVSGTLNYNGLVNGYYYAEYYPNNSNRAIGNKVYFQVGQEITVLNIDNNVYTVGANVNATWTDGPGIPKDWIGVYPLGYDQDSEDLINYHYFDGQSNGSKIIPLTDISNTDIPVGNYVMMMFTDDSYTRVSNIVSFEIQNPLSHEDFDSGRNYDFKVFPNPTENNNFTYFECKYPIDKIELFDSSGKKIFESENIKNNKYTFLNQGLTSGVYLVKIHSNTIYNAKLVIK